MISAIAITITEIKQQFLKTSNQHQYNNNIKSLGLIAKGFIIDYVTIKVGEIHEV